MFRKGNTPWNKGERGLQVAWNKVPGFIITCKFCNKEFRVMPCKSDTKFCSRPCRQKYLWDDPAYRANFIAKTSGRRPWNYGLKGVQICSDETKKKLSEISKGRIFSEEHKRKLSISKLGEKNPVHNPIVRQKISKGWFFWH